jgi:ribose/xylose/arabinose/galactoside ABC-type transport system permease subunit
MRARARVVAQREALLATALVALFLVVGAQRPSFTSWDNIVNLLYDTSTVGILAVGVGIVVIGGGIDISVGSTLAACATIAGLIAQEQLNGWIALLGGAGAGVGLGLVNAGLIVGLRVPAIVATLATLGIFRGVLSEATKSKLVGDFPASFTTFGQGRLWGVPYPAWIMLGLFVVAALALRFTGPGRTLYAVGGNARAARLAGVKVERYQATTYLVAGGLAGLAGAIFAARNGTVLPTSGLGLELLAIAAIVVGGVDIFGGRGTIVGIALGAIFLQSIGAAMVVLGIDIAWQNTVVGVTILAAVVVFALSQRAREAEARG